MKRMETKWKHAYHQEEAVKISGARNDDGGLG